ncbi:Versatile peroxidase [Paramyrothecium foliicola]|nr:Versatile peroxidase [Paramyrothecium foliicola]
MRASIVSVAVALVANIGVSSHPGIGDVLNDIKLVESKQSAELIGDLIDLPDAELTATGRSVKAILLGGGKPQEFFQSYHNVPDRDSEACAQDTCCIWKHIADEMRDSMIGTAGRCNNFARAAIRMAFHDAGTWSKKTGRAGGADGSILLAGECETRRSNNGLHHICAQMRIWYEKYKAYGVTMADMIQMSATVGTVVCPLGPRIRSYVGRKDSSVPSPEGTLPGPKASADEILAKFADKTISAAGIVALLGSHTTSQQHHVEPTRKGDPQDSTPGVFDTRYFQETLDPNAPKRVYKIQSDINLANDPRTNAIWKSFSSPIVGQIRWNEAYAREYIRLSLLGVYNINELTDCTHALPSIRDTFENQDESLLEEWLNGGREYASDAIVNGDKIPE